MKINPITKLSPASHGYATINQISGNTDSRHIKCLQTSTQCTFASFKDQEFYKLK